LICLPFFENTPAAVVSHCTKLSDDEAEKIRKSTKPSTSSNQANISDDYFCQDCQEATGKKTTSKSRSLLTPLTLQDPEPDLVWYRYGVDSLDLPLCHSVNTATYLESSYHGQFGCSMKCWRRRRFVVYVRTCYRVALCPFA
jgi:hypothetical protein